MKLRNRTLLTAALVSGACALGPSAALAEAPAARALTAAALEAPAAAAEAALTGVPVPATGAYAGVAVNAQGGQTWQQAFTDFEDKSGRRLAIHRMYQSWTAPTVSPLTRWDSLNGIIPALSISSPRWAEVAAGAHDAHIVAQARAFKALGTPVLLTFNHEPEFDPDLGTPSEYQAAWRHWVGIYRQEAASNVSFDFIMLGSSFGRGGAVANSFYPGDEFVDWLGVDGYNWYETKDQEWLSFAQVMTGFRTWAVGHNKPLYVAEIGSAEETGDPGRKATWIREMGATLRSWPEVKAVSWFNWYPPVGTPDTFRFTLTSSEESMEAWRQVVADPYLAPNLTNVVQGTPQQVSPPVVASDPMVLAPGQRPSVVAKVTTPAATAVVRVEYGLTSAYGASTPEVVVPASADPVSVVATLPALVPLATYHYRVVARNGGGTSTGADSVVQIPGKPTATTLPAQQAVGTTALASGTVVPNGTATTVTFLYGVSTAYGNSTPPVTLPAGWDPQSLSATLTGLKPGWTYHVRVRTTNAYGTSQGLDRVFKVAAAPKVDTWVPGARTASSITARGSVVAGTLATTYTFQYGTTTAYGSTTPSVTLPAGTTPAAVQAVIAGLAPGTSYHYRTVATNASGTSYGQDRVGATARS